MEAIALKRAARTEAVYLARKRALEREVDGHGNDAVGLSKSRVKSSEPDWSAPCKQPRSNDTGDGLRTFHYRHSTVTRTRRTGTVTTKGVRNPPGAAKRHTQYIEDGGEKLTHDGTAHIEYIDGSRVDVGPNGRLVESNISNDYGERCEFFALVDEHEREEGSHRIQVNFAHDPKLWTAAIADPACDGNLRHAYICWLASGQHKEVQEIELEGMGPALRTVLHRHGFKMHKRQNNAERLQIDGISFSDGRGGRTQHREVFEVPAAFNRGQRRALLKALGEHMKNMGVMYVAVIHAPDPNNDERNWHIHLDFYDRPCRRMSGTEKDLCDRPVKSEKMREAIAAELSAREFDHVKGHWDFTVIRYYRNGRKQHSPFRAHKVEAVNHRDFPKKLRADYAGLVNTVAQDAGLLVRFDPRTYAQMGVLKPAGAKLHQDAHKLEVRGIPTLVGIENEALQAEHDRNEIHRRYDKELDGLTGLWRQLQLVEVDEPALMLEKLRLIERLGAETAKIETRRSIELLRHEQNRERSRPQMVLDRQSRAASQLDTKSAKQARQWAEQANAHLHALREKDKPLEQAILELTPALRSDLGGAGRELQAFIIKAVAAQQQDITSAESLIDVAPAPSEHIVIFGDVTRAPVEPQSSEITSPDDPTEMTEKDRQASELKSAVLVGTAELRANAEESSNSVQLGQSLQPGEDRQPAARQSVGRLLADILKFDRPVIHETEYPCRFNLTVRDPAQDLLKAVIEQPEVQRGLAKIHAMQQAQLTELQREIKAAGIRVQRTHASDRRGPPSYEVLQPTGKVAKLYRRWHLHPGCHDLLVQAWYAQESRDQSLLASSPAPAIGMASGTNETLPGQVIGSDSARRSGSERPPFLPQPNDEKAVTKATLSRTSMHRSHGNAEPGGDECMIAPAETSPPGNASTPAAANRPVDQERAIDAVGSLPALERSKSHQRESQTASGASSATGQEAPGQPSEACDAMANSPPASAANKEGIATPPKDRFGRTREQRDELLRRWKGEDEVSLRTTASQPERARMNEAKEKQQSSAALARDVITEGLKSLEKRFIRLIEDDGYIVALSNEGISDADSSLIRNHQADCRLIKKRQDAQLKETSDFLFDRIDDLAAGEPVQFPPQVNDVIRAWPEDPTIVAHFELVKTHGDMNRTKALKRQRRFGVTTQASQMER